MADAQAALTEWQRGGTMFAYGFLSLVLFLAVMPPGVNAQTEELSGDLASSALYQTSTDERRAGTHATSPVSSRFVSSPSAQSNAPLCSVENGTDVVNDLLNQLVPKLNDDWPSIVASGGLDPWNDVWSGQISLHCSWGGDEMCPLVNPEKAECKKMWADVTVDKLTGLSKLIFDDATANSVTPSDGSKQCSYPTNKGGTPPAGAYSCSYEGTGLGNVSFPNDTGMTAKLTDIKIRVKCKDPIFGDTSDYTLVNGSSTCTVKDPAGSGDFNFCAGSCDTSRTNVPEVLSYAEVTALKIKAKSLSCQSDLYCDVSVGCLLLSPYIDTIVDAIIPSLKDTLITLLTPTIQQEINVLVKEEVPLPPQACYGST